MSRLLSLPNLPLTSMLITALLACSSSSGGADSETDKSDGSRALLALSGGVCERLMECAEQADYLFPWAEVAGCAAWNARRLSAHRVEVGCRGEHDFAVDPGKLGDCLDALEEAPCDALWATRSLYVSVLEGLVPEACLPVAEELQRAEDERALKVPAGGACTGWGQCVFGAQCTTREGCGECRPLPGKGEPCLIDEEEGDGYCALGLHCVDSTCIALPKLGEPCFELEPGLLACEFGLDCQADVCAKLHTRGDACDEQEDAGCGLWMECEAGVCLPHTEERTAKRGRPCEFVDNGCSGGVCIDGVCTDLPGLGAACAHECERCAGKCKDPYACIDEVCTEVADCGTAQQGEICTYTDQCAVGLVCKADNQEDFEGPEHCQPGEVRFDDRCDENQPCSEGTCINGVCQAGPEGSPCSSGYQCQSRECAIPEECDDLDCKGVCVAALACG